MSIPSNSEVNVKGVSKVMVLYTGGTIGMVRNGDGMLAPAKNALESNLRKLGTLHDSEFERDVLKHDGMLVLPQIPNVKRIAYGIHEYDPLLDSSNMSMEDWSSIAKDIGQIYSWYDGFVILHGTDTLSYTASALSFMLQNLGKTVVITGSQIPCFETRSDGRDNLIGALILAGNFTIPEVTVYFNNRLLRGNRTIKVSAGDLHAFDSPNLAPLAKVGIDIKVDYSNILKPCTMARLTVSSNLSSKVAMLRIFPSIMVETVRHFLEPPIEGVVLQCYGAGNIPSNRKDILEAISDGTSRGVIVLCVTQCSHGGVGAFYETGQALVEAGAISGSDITPEAALAKLAHVLSLPISRGQRREMMEHSLCGEMTVQLNKMVDTKGASGSSVEMDMIAAIVQNLKLSSKSEVRTLKDILFPSLLCAATYQKDYGQLEYCLKEEANISDHDYDLRTPLHIAASEGDLDMTRFLLERGALVHKKDRNDDLPIQCAIYSGNKEVVSLLRQVGADLPLAPAQLGEHLVSAARSNKLSLLECYLEAGVSLNTGNLTGDTVLHHAVLLGNRDLVKQLLRLGADPLVRNKIGVRPQDLQAWDAINKDIINKDI